MVDFGFADSAVVKMTTAIPCPSCEGAGTVALSTALESTLAVFTDGDRLSAIAVWNKMAHPSGIGAIHNRLNNLVALGLLRRERVSGNFAYFRSKTDLPIK